MGDNVIQQADQDHLDLVAAAKNLFDRMMKDDFRESGAGRFLNTLSTDPASAQAVEALNQRLDSPEMPMLTKIRIARAYVFTNLCINVGLAHAVGQTKGRITLSFEYGLDVETSRVLISDLVNWIGDLGLGVEFRAMSRPGTNGIDGFMVSWHDISPTDAMEQADDVAV